MVKTRRPQTKRMTKRQRSDLYCAIYLSLGNDRSIKALREFAQIVGIEIPSTGTLTRYSREFGWVDMATAFDRKDQPVELAPTTEVFRLAMEMDLRHMRVGQAMQAKGAAVLNVMPDADVPAAAAVSMLREGVLTERLAGGKATARVEVTMQSMNDLIRIVQGEFKEALEPLRELVPEALITEVIARYSIAVDDKAAQLMDMIGIETDRVEV